MKYIFIFLTTLSFNLSAQGLSGCGEYQFKGILKQDPKAPMKMSYIVNESTHSEMIFYVTENDDIKKLLLMLDVPSSLNASITKPMNGTKGSLSFVSEVSRRFPNPLKSTDTGITKIKTFKCD